MTSVKGILRRFAALSLLGACVLGGASCRLADKRACVTCQGAKSTQYLAEGIDLAPPPDADNPRSRLAISLEIARKVPVRQGPSAI